MFDSLLRARRPGCRAARPSRPGSCPRLFDPHGVSSGGLSTRWFQTASMVVLVVLALLLSLGEGSLTCATSSPTRWTPSSRSTTRSGAAGPRCDRDLELVFKVALVHRSGYGRAASCSEPCSRSIYRSQARRATSERYANPATRREHASRGVEEHDKVLAGVFLDARNDRYLKLLADKSQKSPVGPKRSGG